MRWTNFLVKMLRFRRWLINISLNRVHVHGLVGCSLIFAVNDRFMCAYLVEIYVDFCRPQKVAATDNFVYNIHRIHSLSIAPKKLLWDTNHALNARYLIERERRLLPVEVPLIKFDGAHAHTRTTRTCHMSPHRIRATTKSSNFY